MMQESRKKSLQVALRLTQLVLSLQLIKITESATIALPGCPDRCAGSEIAIPYPFGIGDDCSMSHHFNVTCGLTERNISTPYIYSGIEILSIDLSLGQIREKIGPQANCYNATENDPVGGLLWIDNTTIGPYRVNNEKNKFTVIGCNILASLYINFDYITGNPGFVVGCLSTCSDRETVSKYGKSCSGLGCCQTALPYGMKSFFTEFDSNYNNSNAYNISRCSYAMLIEDGFVFNASDYITPDPTAITIPIMPVMFNWVVDDYPTCEAALKNKTSYACKSQNSVCLDAPASSAGVGYLCNCSNGYEGNPYLENGCQDIDECSASVSANQKSPCSKPAQCHNLPGNYSCSCPFGWRKVDDRTCQLKLDLVIGITIASGVGIGAVLLGVSLVVLNLTRTLKVKRNKQLMKKYFIQNYGILQQRLLSATEDTTGRMKIFSLEELEKATNNFDQARILGHGGHGTVYKGILSDLRVVAIKRSNIVNQSEIDQFINEVVILSQINHRNVVKLLGCCLETEVPLLVNEFISNGTLSDHLHVSESQSLQWKDRLRIALEPSRAISYIHSAASLSVFHRDLKCSNVLLDDCLTAKLSDFGASRSIQMDQTGITTAVQGTFGYLDPEYYRTGRLTDKSDVYSFGVILAELLTREKPNSLGTSSEGGSLIARYVTAVREDCVFEMLDFQIVEEGPREQLELVAKLAERCLRMAHEERPSIKEVEVRLEFIWGGSKKYSTHPPPLPTSHSLFRKQLSILNDSMAHGDNSRQYSLEEEVLLSNQFPR